MTMISSTVAAADDVAATDHNTIREDILRHLGDSGSTTGSANAYILSIDAAYDAYATHDIVQADPNFTNTGAPTININSLGAKSIILPNGNALIAGDITSGEQILLHYNGTAFELLNPATLLNGNDASSFHTHDDAVRQKARTTFQPDENTPFNSVGAGSEAFQEMTYLITTDGSGNSQTIDIVDSNIGSFDKDHVIDVFVKIVGTNNNGFIGIGLGGTAIPTDHLSTVRHAGFFIDDAAIHASQADGSTQNASADLSITVTNWNHLRIEYTAGGNTLLYLNGTLAATLATNQPSGATNYKSYLIGVEGDNADEIFGTYPLIEIEP